MSGDEKNESRFLLLLGFLMGVMPLLNYLMGMPAQTPALQNSPSHPWQTATTCLTRLPVIFSMATTWQIFSEAASTEDTTKT